MTRTPRKRCFWRVPLVVGGWVLAAGACLLAGQRAQPSSVSFDVASIKQVESPDGPAMVIRTPRGGVIDARAVTPRFLIRYAFDVDDALIVGLPEWARVLRFNVRATGPAEVSLDDTRDMLRALLTERFSLRAHHEIRTVPVYLLTRVRAGQLGHNLRSPAQPCTERRQTGVRPPPPQRLAADAGDMRCGLRAAFGHLSGRAVSMSVLLRALIQPTGRPVLDRTAITDTVDFVLNFTPEALRLLPERDTTETREPVPVPASPGAPSIYSAIREQLGLRLEPSTGPVEMLTVDHLEKPTPD